MNETTDTPTIHSQILAERTHLAIPSLPSWIEPTVEYLRQKAILCGACHEPRADKLLIALLEALSNAVIHGNLQISSELKERGDDAFARAMAEQSADPVLSARVVDILVEYDGECCRWVITDEGAGFDVERVVARCLGDDSEAALASGRGILMMHSLLDDVRYDLGGRRLTMTLLRPSGQEKRCEPRVPINLPFRIAPLNSDGSPDWAASYDAVARDLSRGGVALVQEGLAQGQHILIGMKAGGKTVYVPAEVRHYRTLGEGSVELGCAFQVEPPHQSGVDSGISDGVRRVHDAVLDMLAAHQAPELTAQERRVHSRVAFNKAVTINIDGETVTYSGYSRDLSKGGMSLITRTSLPLGGGRVTVPRPGAPSLQIRSRVVRCNKIQEGYFDVGLQFLSLDEPPR